MLPKGWSRLPLGNIAQITSGGTPDRANPAYWGGDIPWVTTGEVHFNKITDTVEKITEVGLINSSAKLFPAGTLLMAMYGQGKTRGQMARLGISAATNQACAAICLRDDHDSDFFFHLLSSKYDSLRKLSNDGAQQNLSGSIIKQFVVTVPSAAEQRAIARVVDCWDEAIATTERLLANSRKQKQSLFNSLLRQSNSWERQRLDDIATKIQRRTEGGDHPVLMISAASGFVKQSEMYSRFMAGKSLESYTLLNRGEFAYNKGNSKSYEFGCVYPLDLYPQGLVPHVYICFSMNEDRCYGSFYKYLFEADYLHDQLGALVNTGVRNNGLLNIRPTDFMGTSVPVPPIENQRKIATILDVATASINHQEQSLQNLRLQKCAMMQQLLTGKRRVQVSKQTEAALT